MRIKSGYRVREIAGENVVIMSGQAGVDMARVITLNDSSLLLWNNLMSLDFTTSDVERILLENYEVEKCVAATDAQKWVDKMQQAGLIE